MRRSERHHLKENAFAVVIASMSDRLQEWGRGLAIGLAIGVGLVVAYGGYSWWSSRTDAAAGVLLADALMVADAPVVPPPAPTPSAAADGESGDAAAPAASTFVQPAGTYPSLGAKMTEALPLLLEAADAYPGTAAGITARYRAAAALAAIGRQEEAAAQYRRVIDTDTGVYGRMATLGLAEVELARGAAEEAVALLEEATAPGAVGDLPIDGVLMQLARAYERAGRTGDARATYQRLMDEHPTSLYVTAAQRELDTLGTAG